ncbi:DUF1285 domain-containing protein [Thalassotalea aquiviva]|uniref:DUF1285 domain-containing protein n=1 Tax=Thalassotalea aquiviva TaxID=3242415 RepID=UPI00352A7186
MSLEKFSKQIKIPQVEQWDPPYCGEIDIEIKANGDWFYQGSKIERKRLVKLLSSVLTKEAEDYFLVTPVEKMKIRVQHRPFVITQWQWMSQNNVLLLKLLTNLDDEIWITKPKDLGFDEHGKLIANVRRNLYASIHRNVFYQWVEQAKEGKNQQGHCLYLTSNGLDFVIGYV